MTERESAGNSLPHATGRVAAWAERWKRTDRMVLLLDFDGTLAPIVERPEAAGMPARTREIVERLIARPGLEAAIVSGRGLADARKLAALDGVAYAGNHGMEIEGPGIHRIHPEAASARPSLVSVIRQLEPRLAGIPGALLEDKGLTLSIHYRLVDRDQVGRVRALVRDAVAADPRLRITEGKEVLEVRPAVDWHKGRAVEFLLDSTRPPAEAPIVYIGDDTTDEDAFRAVRRWQGGEGVIVGDPLPDRTWATAFVGTPAEVADLLELLLRNAPMRPAPG
jgi:trehalose 6-phosphate phosphatase